MHKVTIKIKTPNRLIILNNKKVRTPVTHTININELKNIESILKSQTIEYEICEYEPKQSKPKAAIEPSNITKDIDKKTRFKSTLLNQMMDEETF